MSGFHGIWLRTVETEGIVFTWTRFDCGGTLASHLHNHAYASLVLDGSYTELHGFDPRWCTAGTAIVHRAGEVHADCFHERCVVVNAESQRDDTPAEKLIAALSRFLPSVSVATGTPEECRPAWVDDACALLSLNGAATPGEAAELVGRHPTDFSRVFRRYLGVTPGAFQRRARIRRAVRLLMTSRLKLVDVAHECGFSDQSHFTNAFAREAGMPPQRFVAAFTE